MGAARRITVGVPPELLAKAQRASGASITETVRIGLQLLAAAHAHARLRQQRGKIRMSKSLTVLTTDR